MIVRELSPGDRVLYRGETYTLDHHIDGGAISWFRDPDNPKHTACLPSSWAVEAGEIHDRPRGAARPLRVETRDDAAAGGQATTARRGGPGRDPSRRSPEGATPGVLMHEVVDPPSRIEDVLDLGFIEGLAVLLAIGAVAWTLGDFPAFQGPLAAAGAVGLAVVGRIRRRRAEG